MTARARPADATDDGIADVSEGTRSEPGIAVRYRVMALAVILVALIAAAMVIADPPASAPAVDGTPAQEIVSSDPGDAGVAVPAAAWQRPALSADALAATVGVRLSQLSLSGGGGLIDLRVLVVDPELADAIHDPEKPIAVIDEATGVVASSLLMGHSHTDKFQAGHVYYFVLENPGNLIQRDAEVSVLLGNAQLDHVVVR